MCHLWCAWCQRCDCGNYKERSRGKPKVSFNAYAGFGSNTSKVEMLNPYDYAVYVNELYYNSSDATAIANGTWNKPFQQE